MRHMRSLAAMALTAATAQASTIDLQLQATTPTQITVGGSVDFQLSFRQYQESWSFDNNGPEPTADIGIQSWQFYFFDTATEHLVALALEVGAAGGPLERQLLAPNAPPGADHATTWDLRLSFSQPGLFQVLGLATATQEKMVRSGATVGTRECVGFDNSVQCTGWTFVDQLQENPSTDTSRATSLPVAVQVLAQPVPEPPTGWLLLLCSLIGAPWLRQRLAGQARHPRLRTRPG